MNETIKNLFYGNINPLEQMDLRSDTKYRKALDNSVKAREALVATMDKK